MAWTLATGAAVTLSWWGVHTVVVGTVYDRPRALPITGDHATTQRAHPRSSSTHRPPSPPPPSPSSSSSSGASAPKPPKSPKPTASSAGPAAGKPSTTPPPKPPENVRSYPVDGGRVVFDLGSRSAELVSATPEAGWQMQVWKQDFWIRVTFTRGDREISVFCTWHDSPPRVQIDER